MRLKLGIRPDRLRGSLAALLLSALALSAAAHPVLAQGVIPGTVTVNGQGLVPADFFNAPVDADAPAGVEADQLVFDAANNTITATGDVVLSQDGYTVAGQDLVYERNDGKVAFRGAVTIRDPSGNLTHTENLQLEGGFRQAFLDAMVIETYDGARITADSLDYDEAVQTLLINASYAPCGECIDAQGRRIGWSVKASRILYNADDGSVELDNPTLALLGVPVAWLPYLWLPNLSNDALDSVPKPTFAYAEETGLRASVSFDVYSSAYTDIVLTPTLMTRQGGMLGAQWTQRLANGVIAVTGSGVYQLDPEAFDYEPAQQDWRGSIQVTGRFVPAEDWTAGWSYSAFSDPAYYEDYQLDPGPASVNEVYATNLTADTFLDARVQQFNILGDTALTKQEQQGIALPNVRFERTLKLAPGAGQVTVSSRLLGVQRNVDAATTVNGVPYVFGYAGSKLHGMVEADWQSQWIVPGGIVARPFVGLRADGAYYDGQSDLALAPEETSLWSATPIAAMDVRYPLAASSPGMTHLVEPIAQLVYRGAADTLPGITNEDSQGVVLDDTSLFSYNRFSGIDRQETGLRANIGGRYLANFDDGSYVELIAGQSFHLAGTNAFAQGEVTNSAVESGLEEDSSYGVLALYGSFTPGLVVGGKLLVDNEDFDIARASLGSTFSQNGWAASVDYRFTRSTPELGNLKDEHEVGGELTVPVAEYWSVRSGVYWDLVSNNWLQASAGVVYDDGYLQLGASALKTGPTHRSPDDTRFTASFLIKAPAGFNAGYSGAVPFLGN